MTNIILIFEPPTNAGDLDMDIEDDFGFRLRDGGSLHHSNTKTVTAADEEPVNSITTDTADVVVGPTDLQNETDDDASVIDENTTD